MDLYIKITCSACVGNQKTWYGRVCPYCTYGKTFVKITNSNLIKYILEFDEKDKKKIFEALIKDEEKKDN